MTEEERPVLAKFPIPREDQPVFATLDKVRLNIKVLDDLLRQQRETERSLAGQLYAKYEIPVDAAIGFKNWVVTHVGGRELPDPGQVGLVKNDQDEGGQDNPITEFPK